MHKKLSFQLRITFLVKFFEEILHGELHFLCSEGNIVNLNLLNPLSASDLQCKSIDWFLYEGNTGT